MDGIWTTDRTEQLRTLLAGGWSSSEIAHELGCFTYCADGGRSAVCGKIHRMGLSTPRVKKPPVVKIKPPVVKSKGGPERHNQSNSFAEKLALARAAPGLPEHLLKDEPRPGGIKLEELTGSTCRWPFGDPKTPEFEFCGACPVKGLPYCAEHALLAYQAKEST